MAIDPSIPLQGQGIKLENPLDAMSKVATLKQLARQGKMQDQQMAEEESIKNAFKKNVVVGPDGKEALNKPAVLSDLYKTNPAKAVEAEQTFRQQEQQQKDAELKQALQQTEMKKQIAWSMKDEQSYLAGREQALKMGLPGAETMPAQYPGPGYIQQMQMGTLTAAEQLAQQWKQKEYQQKEREIGAKAATAKAKSGKMTPTQAKQRGLYEQGVKAEEQYNAAISGKGWDRYDPSSNFNWIDKNDWAPKLLKSKESIRAESAQDRWVEAFLRDASGAAIPPSERGAYAKDFFPVAGDSEQIVKDKAEARRVKMESAKRAAGEQVDHYSGMSDEEIDRLYREAGGT